jgi:hypothetical protein
MRQKGTPQPEPSIEESDERLPTSGDVFLCEICGMELEITADCGCDDGPRLECCDQPMSRTDEMDIDLI